MATSVTPTPQEMEQRKNLLKQCQSIIDTPIDQLTQIDKYGKAGGFESIRPLFEKTILVFRKLASSNFDLATERRLRSLSDTANGVLNEFNSFRNYNIDQVPLHERTQRIQTFAALFDKASDEIARFIALNALAVADTGREEAQLRLQEIRTIKESAEKEIPEILRAIREVAEKVGMVEHARLFAKEANEHRTSAKNWLIATACLFVGTGIFAVRNYFLTLNALTSATQNVQPGTTGTGGLAIQLTIAKVIVLSLMFSAVVWAGRIYRAHRHNFVVNKHRQNALSTFEVFVKAGSADEQTKNAILLQATQCIFSPQNTGYLAQGDKEGEMQSHILEIYRGMSSKA